MENKELRKVIGTGIDRAINLQKEKFMLLINDRMKSNKGNIEVLRELLYIKAELEGK